jgi:hypothetical protein
VLLITAFLIVYIALLEFLSSEGRIRGWLMVGHGLRASCGGRGKKQSTTAGENRRDLEGQSSPSEASVPPRLFGRNGGVPDSQDGGQTGQKDTYR